MSKNIFVSSSENIVGQCKSGFIMPNYGIWPFKNKNRESKDDPKDKKLGQSGDHH